MNKKYLFMILAVVIFVIGCEGEQIVVDVGESPYIGGNKGLVAEFLQMGIYNEESNMEEIFESETFPIEVVLKNKGEEDVIEEKVIVTLMGINLDDFENVDAELTNEEIVIEKVSDLNEEGGEITIDFTSAVDDANYTIPLTGSSYDVSVFARVVYEYTTHAAVPKVCYKRDFSDKTVCTVDEIKDVYSSGAPIQVISAEEKKAGTAKIGIEFKIENVGSGEVAMPGGEFDARYDMLSFSVSDPELWECKAGGRVNEARLDKDGKATIICRIKTAITEEVPFTKQLDLTLNYDYREIIHKQVRVKKQ